MPGRIHQFPKILALAILLIEIERGSPIAKYWIPEFFGEDEQPNTNTYYCTAAHLLESCDQQRKWDEQETFSEHKSIIRACLDRDIFDMAESDIFSQRVALYTYVVRPLEMLYQKAWIDSEAKILPLLYWKTIPTDTGETSTATKGYLPAADQVDLPDKFSRCVPEYRTIPRRSEFTIAIICALTLEADAVAALFDETYDRLGQRYGKEPGDTNAYVNGNIGQHNVVLCYMSGVGKGSAATLATNLGFSYTEIPLALIVGVCGGAPRLPADNTDGPGSTKDVFLGDVIISNAVVQYDFGRQSPDGFKRKTAVTDILGRPNQEVRSLLAGIKAKRAHQEFLENMAHHMEALRETDTLWQHPKLDDVLYDSSYAHTSSSEPHPNSVRCSCLNDDPRQTTSAVTACNSGCHKDSSSIIRRRQQHDEHSASDI
ncbi:hypothetical protein BJX65DRAFT_308849 [Aspergillus insuetus]